MTRSLADDAVASAQLPAELEGRLFFTVMEVATLTRTDPRTVRRGIERGDFPAVRIADTVRIPAAPFLALAGLTSENSGDGPREPVTALTSVPVKGMSHSDDGPPAA